MKVICALRTLSYGIPSDLSDEMFNVYKTTAALCFIKFCRAIRRGLAHKYIRDPTVEELKVIEKEFAKFLDLQDVLGA